MSAADCCEPTKQVTKTKRLMQTKLLLSPVPEGAVSKKSQQRQCSPVKAARLEENRPEEDNQADVETAKDTKDSKDSKDTKNSKDAKALRNAKNSQVKKDVKVSNDSKDAKDLKEAKKLQQQKQTSMASKGRSRRSRSCDAGNGQSAKTLTKAVSLENFFPVQRRSERRLMKQQAEESETRMLRRLLTNCQEGLKVVEIEGKGRGVVATRRFDKDELVVEYKGDMIDYRTAKAREEAYNADPGVGCYMYFFMLRDTKMCVDATAESPHYGRLLNHSRLNPNCYTKVVTVEGEAHLCLFAKRSVSAGEELLYDYGDRDPATLAAHPWLKT